MSVFLVIDESKSTVGSVGRIVSQHKTLRAARAAAGSIQHYLRRAQGRAAAAAIALYRTDIVVTVGAMASAQSTWPVETSDPQP